MNVVLYKMTTQIKAPPTLPLNPGKRNIFNNITIILFLIAHIDQLAWSIVLSNRQHIRSCLGYIRYLLYVTAKNQEIFLRTNFVMDWLFKIL